MRIGLALNELDLAATAADARSAEAQGFDLVASGEHLFFHGPVPNAFIVLAAASAVTHTVRLLTSLTILPLYPAALAAKLAATLDCISNGRLELGIGVGGEFPAEFAAVGVRLEDRGARTDQALGTVKRLLAGEAVTAHSEFGVLEGLSLNPPAIQRPNPPLWVGGRKRAAMRRAGRFADVFMPYMMSPDQFRGALQTARAYAEQAGRDPAVVRGAIFLWGSVDDDSDRCRREVIESVSATYNQDFSALADRYLLHGTPSAVLGRLQEYRRAGVETVIFAPACSAERRSDVVNAFAQAVLPTAQSLADED
jgi:alkanesulfonate monooxygenase SsuD/methylene tetrahydromethanopterin reductase-like flavin-dependent oxidoreductase (luciferase family)